jgi:SAM-dependent methyltransferase
MRPTEMAGILSVPGTNKALSLVVFEHADGEPYNGLVKDEKGKIVGVLSKFRFEFVDYIGLIDDIIKRTNSEPKPALIPASKFIDPFSDAISWQGKYIDVAGYLRGFDSQETNGVMCYVSSAPRVSLCLHSHGWSGIVQVSVNGAALEEIDLFNRENAVRRNYYVNNPSSGKMDIAVRPTGSRNVDAQSSQFLLEGIIEFTNKLQSPVYKKQIPVNRGGEFLPRFYEIMKTLPEDAVVLDVGGGKRQIDDARYVNMEYSRFEEPDVLGDGTKLPFRNESVDFVYTAAVLEHVRDPLKMGSEIFRVLKKGGTVLANSAFMQPIHSEGQHFFNLTPYGIELVFERFRDKKVWWNNDFHFTMDWFVRVTKVRTTANEETVTNFLNAAKALEASIAYDRAMYVASGVWLEGRK